MGQLGTTEIEVNAAFHGSILQLIFSFLLLGDTEADEGYDSPGMVAVGGDEGCGCGVGGELCAGGDEHVRDEVVVAVVAEGVGGDVADGGLGEDGWEYGARG